MCNVFFVQFRSQRYHAFSIFVLSLASLDPTSMAFSRMGVNNEEEYIRLQHGSGSGAGTFFGNGS